MKARLMAIALACIGGLAGTAAAGADDYASAFNEPLRDFSQPPLDNSFGEALDDAFTAFENMSGPVMEMIELGNTITEQGQIIYDGMTATLEIDPAMDLTLGTMCLSHEACSVCATSHVQNANRAYEVLRNNRGNYNLRMRQIRMAEVAAEAAARGHQAAGAAYATMQATQIEPARQEYLTNLAAAQNDALALLSTSLQQIGACETQHLGVNTFAAISRNTVALMRERYVP